jgi:hypothetical protein
LVGPGLDLHHRSLLIVEQQGSPVEAAAIFWLAEQLFATMRSGSSGCVAPSPGPAR